ncbi:MAG: hypothetical protein N3A56_08390, partial [Thermodesulfobacteriaceae bacterium]|nr:hypothetical protein [Thermodesulfobacteriaceae bacterium]
MLKFSSFFIIIFLLFIITSKGIIKNGFTRLLNPDYQQNITEKVKIIPGDVTLERGTKFKISIEP